MSLKIVKRYSLNTIAFLVCKENYMKKVFSIYLWTLVCACTYTISMGQDLMGEDLSESDIELNFAERNWFDAAEQGDVARLEELLMIEAPDNPLGAEEELLSIQNINAKRIGTEDTALYLAAQNGKYDAVKWLLEHGASTRISDDIGETPLHAAVSDENELSEDVITNIVTLLLAKSDIDVNALDMNKNTALYLAVDGNHLGAVNALLNDHRTNIYLRSPDGLTARDLAVMLGHVDIINRFEKIPTLTVDMQIDARVRWYYAISADDINGVKKGLAQGQSLTQTIEGISPLQLAVAKQHYKIMKLLLRSKAPINQISLLGDTALHLAVENEDPKAIKILLNHGATASLSIKNGDGKTPEMLAAEIEDPKVKTEITNYLSKKHIVKKVSK